MPTCERRGKLVGIKPSIPFISLTALFLVVLAFPTTVVSSQDHSSLANEKAAVAFLQFWPVLGGNGSAWPSPWFVVDFQMSPANPSTATGITLIATADNDSRPFSFNWNFGDNHTGSGQTVSHFYTAPGSYLITLTVRDSIGQTRQVAKQVSVSPPPPPPLLVNMSFTTRTPLTGEHLVFKSNITGGSPPYTVLWSFGDRHTGNKTRLSHTYYSAGDYNVTLTVRDSGGLTTVSSTIITVSQYIPPVTVPQKTQAQETADPGTFLSDQVLVGLAVLIFTVSVGFLVLWKRALQKVIL